MRRKTLSRSIRKTVKELIPKEKLLFLRVYRVYGKYYVEAVIDGDDYEAYELSEKLFKEILKRHDVGYHYIDWEDANQTTTKVYNLKVQVYPKSYLPLFKP